MPGSRVSLGLRERGKSAWAAATSHPIVRQIGAGTLPYETFRRYFEQNILYLEDYARAIGLIIGKSPDYDAADVLSRFLRQIVGIEIPSNVDFLHRVGGSPGTAGAMTAMLPVTYGYTRHLLYTSAQGSCAEGLAAVLPCQWSYGELAAPLAAALPAEPVYADWVSMFGNDSYSALVAETTGLLDRLADPGDAAAMARLAWIFDISTRYEVQFWDMAYDVPTGHGGPDADGGLTDGEPAGDGGLTDGEPASDGGLTDGEPAGDGVLTGKEPGR
ncbi:MAG TPA: TenA family protein [Streptosporangiaceae bacterium]